MSEKFSSGTINPRKHMWLNDTLWHTKDFYLCSMGWLWNDLPIKLFVLYSVCIIWKKWLLYRTCSIWQSHEFQKDPCVPSRKFLRLRGFFFNKIRGFFLKIRVYNILTYGIFTLHTTCTTLRKVSHVLASTATMFVVIVVS